MTMKIRLDRIDPNPDQPRKNFDQTALQELANSIKARGLLQPICVRPFKRDRYQITAGERRWRAHVILRDAGHKKFASIDAIVRKITDATKNRLAAIVENMQRADMTPMEEASAFKSLVDDGMTPAEIATELGLAEFRVTWRLQLLNLAPEPLKLFESGQLDRQQALEISRLDKPSEQRRIVQLINRGQLVGWKSVRNAVDTINGGMTQADIFGEMAPRPPAKDLATLTAMERRIDEVATMIGQGWKNGECIIAARVNLDRATLMAERLAEMQKALRIMERELRNTTAQGQVAI
jgi:ParB/RepB/Spo0J family partition protein